jgi:hypothetical protein
VVGVWVDVEKLEYKNLSVFDLNYFAVDHFMISLKCFLQRPDWNKWLFIAHIKHPDSLLRITLTNNQVQNWLFSSVTVNADNSSSFKTKVDNERSTFILKSDWVISDPKIDKIILVKKWFALKLYSVN